MKSEASVSAKHTTKPVATAAHTHGVSRLAMMAIAFFASPLGLARMYRGDPNGKVRFWLYVGAMFAMAVPYVNIIAGLVMLVLLVWGVVDFFTLYGETHDAQGQPLLTTARDERWIEMMRTVYIVVLVISAAMLLIAISLSINGLTNSSPHYIPRGRYY